MNILVTGSGGFVGSHLLEFLDKKDHKVFTLGTNKSNRKDHLHIKNFKDKGLILDVLTKTRPDLIFHLAGVPYADSYNRFADLNFRFAQYLINANIQLTNLPTRIILVGSSAEYGFVEKENLPISESLKPDPYSDYGKTKLLQTKLAMEQSNNECPIVVFRPFNLLGPRMPNYLSVGNFLEQLKSFRSNNNQKHFLEVGNLNVYRDFLYVKDFVEIIWTASNHEDAYGNIYNVCSGEPVLLKQIVENMIKISGLKIIIRERKDRLRENDMTVHYGDNTKVLELIGGKKLKPWEEVIEEMFYKEVNEK